MTVHQEPDHAHVFHKGFCHIQGNRHLFAMTNHGGFRPIEKIVVYSLFPSIPERSFSSRPGMVISKTDSTQV